MDGKRYSEEKKEKWERWEGPTFVYLFITMPGSVLPLNYISGPLHTEAGLAKLPGLTSDF